MDRKKILLVEDNQDDCELTIIALKKNNMLNEIQIVHDGEEALDYLFGRGRYSDNTVESLPALILLDLHLPKLDGFEVLKEIRSYNRTKYLPVVILTSSKDDQDIIKGYDLGVNSYVQKPVDFEHFLKAVSQLGLYWLILNETPGLYSV